MEHPDFWHSSTSIALYNPRAPEKEQTLAQSLPKNFPHLKGHLWIATSGSSSEPKWAALSKEALLCSAKAVNRHLQTTKNDRWLNPLPLFHVGGLSVLARSHLSHFQVKHCPWNPQEFVKTIESDKTTLSALVPAQIFDLVTLQLKAPPSIRAVIVGGGRLPTGLYHKALALKWPLLISYGLTECGSQVATMAIENIGDETPTLQLLSHIQASINEEGLLVLKSDALLTGYAIQGLHFYDPKIEGSFVTSDRAILKGDQLEIFGRANDFIKIGGESVSLPKLEKRWEELLMQENSSGESLLIAIEEPRLGHVIHLATTNETVTPLVEAFNESVFPFEKIRKVHFLPYIPKTALGKVSREKLARLIAISEK